MSGFTLLSDEADLSACARARRPTDADDGWKNWVEVGAEHGFASTETITLFYQNRG
jgi:hypothetical protein